MAYLVDLRCAGGCGRKTVSVRIYGRYNSEEGLFCSSCGKRRLKKLQDIERDNEQFIQKRRAESGDAAAAELRKQLR